MGDNETAEFFEQRRGDMSLWEKEPSKADVRKGTSVVFSFRLTTDELRGLREAAKQRGVNVSELIRSAALREIEEDLPITHVKTIMAQGNLVTGLYHVSMERQSFGSQLAGSSEEEEQSLAAAGYS